MLLSLTGIVTGSVVTASQAASDFDTFLNPLFAANCTTCHGEEEVNGKVNLKEITSAKQFLGNPTLIKEVIEAIDANDMPPEGEPPLDEKVRTKLLSTLKTLLREATSGEEVKQLQIRRLNRFQYNNSVKDLFRLKVDVFELPEKLMTRRGNYLNAVSNKMPDQVDAASLSLNPTAGLSEVKAFPKDLRAAHGFDNQANQLTLSPLLLDAFLRLSVSIVESPDFNEQNVGIWNDFFKEPTTAYDMQTEIRSRLDPFLKMAFRSTVDSATLDRYSAYAMSKMNHGLSFTDSMKKVASAALSSPMFLYRSPAADGNEDQFALASRLSFFLWGSSPDLELLQLAESGELSKPENLNNAIGRMFADPKIERFLDAFPSQWMQLENVLAATPDPNKHRLFSLDKNNPASLQMVLEPLLLFDAVFIEDRPIVELISPKFSYQSEFLKTWYTTDLNPPQVDTRKIAEENRHNEQRRKGLDSIIETTQAELAALVQPVKAKLLADRKKDAGVEEPVDLKPYAAWEFNGDLKESINSLDLTAHGKIDYQDGMVVLNKAYLLSEGLPIELKAKTLEVWLKLDDVEQRGGGVMGIQGPGDFFDTIVLGERQSRHWISGSNGFSRTEDFPDSSPESTSNQVLHLAMVYTEEGTTTLYRNGNPYGKPYRKGAAAFPKNDSSVIFGLRHLPAGGNKFLSVSLDKARLYDRALTAAEVASSSSGDNLYISNEELLQALTSEQKAKWESLRKSIEQSEVALELIPQPQDPEKVQQDTQKRFEDEIRKQLRSEAFERVAASDPRYGGVITNAAMLSMTSGPKRTHPIARGAWIIEVIFNDPPPPPPNDVPPLNDESSSKELTIREKFAVHRENPTCAGCHSRLDPLGFALENFDITGRWRDKYENGRDVDSSGTLMRKHEFDGIGRFKESLVKENRRFAKAFTGHLLRFALARELTPYDSLTVDTIVDKTEKDGFKLKSLIKEVILSDRFF
ncbi:MAG: DUF1588 domain-containing protein [Planctomycetes bacterium]|nr:DUF1588 domain-containing protein [Planctomycetota bacterium]